MARWRFGLPIVLCLLAAAQLSAASGTHAVVFGKPVPEGELRWMVSIQFPAETEAGNPFKNHGCGGVLISQRHVLTAAHCVAWPDGRVMVPEQLGVYVGSHTLESESGQTIDVDNVMVHPEYQSQRNSPLKRNDIAILRLAEAPAGITPAAIQNSGDHSVETAGALLSVAGWGSIEPYGRPYGRKTRYSPRLQSAELRVVTSKTCRDRLRERGIRGLQSATSICAVPQPGGSCWNDSGGPLYTSVNGETIVVGALSWGVGCGIAKMPEMYTRLSDPGISAWISEQLSAT